MKFLKGFVIAVVTLVVVFCVGGLLISPKWKVERSITINAPPPKVFGYVADMKEGWPQWSSFDYEDPEIQYSYSGNPTGQGSIRHWTSKKMGNGYQTMTYADPNFGVQFELVMIDNGFKIVGNIDLIKTETGTKVVWRDTGDSGSNLAFRWMSLFMDGMMGKTFESSLQKLKAKSEAP